MAHQAGAYPGFCSMKRLGIFLLSPGWEASPLQGCVSVVSVSFFLAASRCLATGFERYAIVHLNLVQF